jgi:hypothetical protein
MRAVYVVMLFYVVVLETVKCMDELQASSSGLQPVKCMMTICTAAVHPQD